MKKITLPKDKSLPPVRLYREELDYLVELFRRKSDKFEISDGSYIFSDLDEMQSHLDKELTEIQINSQKPPVRLRLENTDLSDILMVPVRHRFNHVWVDNDTEDAEWLFHKIEEYLRKHRTYNVSWPFLTSSLLLFLIAVTGARYASSHHLPILSGTAAPIILLGMWCFIFAFRGAQNRIILAKRSERLSFWQRKSDDIIVTLFVGLILAIVSFFLGRLTKH